MSTETTPTVHRIDTNPVPVQESPEVVESAKKFVRAKSLVKSSFKRVGVPVLIGATAAYVVTRKARSNDAEDLESSNDTNIPE